VRYRPGPRSRMTDEIASYMRALVAAQPDLTLAELQHRLELDRNTRFSIGRLWALVRQLGLRLNKSRSTPPSAIPKSTKSGAKSSLQK